MRGNLRWQTRGAEKAKAGEKQEPVSGSDRKMRNRKSNVKRDDMVNKEGKESDEEQKSTKKRRLNDDGKNVEEKTNDSQPVKDGIVVGVGDESDIANSDGKNIDENSSEKNGETADEQAAATVENYSMGTEKAKGGEQQKPVSGSDRKMRNRKSNVKRDDMVNKEGKESDEEPKSTKKRRLNDDVEKNDGKNVEEKTNDSQPIEVRVGDESDIANSDGKNIDENSSEKNGETADEQAAATVENYSMEHKSGRQNTPNHSHKSDDERNNEREKKTHSEEAKRRKEDDKHKSNDNKQKKRKEILQKKKKKVTLSLAESTLIRMDTDIKKALHIDHLDIDKCVAILEDLDAFSVSPMMLRQSPAILATIKNCRKFKKSSAIQQKAKVIYHKFMSLFLVEDSGKNKTVRHTRSSQPVNLAENTLTHMDTQIKKALNIDSLDIDKCVAILEDLDAFSVSPMMLRQSPAILATIKNCRKFKKSSAIQQKAKVIYHKFMSLFLVEDSGKNKTSSLTNITQSEKDVAETTVPETTVPDEVAEPMNEKSHAQTTEPKLPAKKAPVNVREMNFNNPFDLCDEQAWVSVQDDHRRFAQYRQLSTNRIKELEKILQETTEKKRRKVASLKDQFQDYKQKWEAVSAEYDRLHRKFEQYKQLRTHNASELKELEEALDVTTAQKRRNVAFLKFQFREHKKKWEAEKMLLSQKLDQSVKFKADAEKAVDAAMIQLKNFITGQKKQSTNRIKELEDLLGVTTAKNHRIVTSLKVQFQEHKNKWEAERMLLVQQLDQSVKFKTDAEKEADAAMIQLQDFITKQEKQSTNRIKELVDLLGVTTAKNHRIVTSLKVQFQEHKKKWEAEKMLLVQKVDKSLKFRTDAEKEADSVMTQLQDFVTEQEKLVPELKEEVVQSQPAAFLTPADPLSPTPQELTENATVSVTPNQSSVDTTVTLETEQELQRLMQQMDDAKRTRQLTERMSRIGMESLKLKNLLRGTLDTIEQES